VNAAEDVKERFHHTLKKALGEEARYYNSVRPQRAMGRRTPAEAFGARTNAVPTPRGR
jgi:transposase InsO family protein